jgi:non-ribosomal peptide synthase protein (TIGR01720 family)
MPQAEVCFNYLSQLDYPFSASTLCGLAHESYGPPQSLRGNRRYLLDINGRIAGGQLQMDWTYSEDVHRRTTIEKLAKGFIEALRALITHCQSPEAMSYTPSDFPNMELSQQELDELMLALEDASGGNETSTG